MPSEQISRTLQVAAVILAVALSAASPLYGQAEKPLTWLQDLNYLESISKSDVLAHQEAVADIRVEVQRWIDLHPNSGVTLPEAPARPWNAEQTANQIQALHQTVELIIKEDPEVRVSGSSAVANGDLRRSWRGDGTRTRGLLRDRQAF